MLIPCMLAFVYVLNLSIWKQGIKLVPSTSVARRATVSHKVLPRFK
jgi:hypothetical protein